MKTLQVLILSLLTSFLLTGCYTQLQLPDYSYSNWDNRSSSEPIFDYSQVAPEDTSYLYGFEDGVAYAERYFVNYDQAWGYTPASALWNPFDPWMNVGGWGMGWNHWGWNSWNAWNMNPFWGFNNWMAWDPWFGPSVGFGGWFAPGWGNGWVVYNAHTSRPNHLRSYGPRNGSVAGQNSRHNRVFSGSSTRSPRSGYSTPSRSSRSGSTSVGRSTRTRSSGTTTKPTRTTRTRSSGSVSRGSNSRSSKSSGTKARPSRPSNNSSSRSGVKTSTPRTSRSSGTVRSSTRSSSKKSSSSRKSRTISDLLTLPIQNQNSKVTNNTFSTSSNPTTINLIRQRKPSSLVRALGFLGGIAEGVAIKASSTSSGFTNAFSDGPRNTSSSSLRTAATRSSRN